MRAKAAAKAAEKALRRARRWPDEPRAAPPPQERAWLVWFKHVS